MKLSLDPSPGELKGVDRVTPKSRKTPDPNRPTPHALYRYRPLIDDKFDEERTKPLFVTHQLYFPSRRKLNDPFECVVPSFLDTPPGVLQRFLRNKVRKFCPDLTQDQVQKRAATIDLGRLRQDVQANVDRVGILSLTEKPDDLLMWSHYANGHRGLCLEFSTPMCDPFFGRALPVVYSNNRTMFDPRESAIKQVEKVILTKSKHWLYELEWRIAEHQNGEGFYEFPAETLTGVVFGCGISDRDKAKVQRWISEGGLKPRNYQAKQKAREFGLEIDRIS